MTEVVLRHPDLPGQPIIGTVNPDGTVVPNLSDSGWVIDADADLAAARREQPPAREPAEVPSPHFATAPEPEAPAEVAAPVAEPAAAPAPETPADVQPATTEQGDTSLELTKE